MVLCINIIPRIAHLLSNKCLKSFDHRCESVKIKTKV